MPVLSAVALDSIRKEAEDKEYYSKEVWTNKWGFTVNIYKGVQDKIKRIREADTRTTYKTKKPDSRRLGLPRTSNGAYGFLSTKPEFRLERYGPDIPHALPVNPEESDTDYS